MAARAPAQTTSKAAQGLLPQLEAAIAYLNEEIAQIRSGQKDQSLHDLIADPLPREQFRGLLQVWKLPPVPVELSKLFVQLEQLREQEKKENEQREAEEREAREKEKVGAEEKAKADQEKEELEAAPVGDGEETKEDEPDTAEDQSVEEKSEADDAKQPERKDEQQPPRRTRGRPRRQPLTVGENEEDKPVANKAHADVDKAENIVSESPINSPAKAERSVVETASASAGETQEVTDKIETPSVVVETAPPAPAVFAPTQETTVPVTATPAVLPTTATVTVPVAAPAATTQTTAPTTTPMPVPVRAPTSAPTQVPSQAPTPTKADAAREIALVNLRALRRSMMLDVLSKIVSVAKSKGVDPAMFSPRANAASGSVTEAPARSSSFVDLEMIHRDVSKGSIAEWEHFAQQVYLFCQHVIAESEKQDRQDAKQKGVELLHFAKTLTETLRKASLKKEETIMKTTPTTTPTAAVPSAAQPTVVPIRPTLPPVVAPTPPVMPAQPPATVPEDTTTKVVPGPSKSVATSDSPAAYKKSPVPASPVVIASDETAPTSTSAVGSPSSGAAPIEAVTTPHRMSTRLRQRENSVTDSPSPSRRRAARSAEDDQTDGTTSATPTGVETRTRKRPRASAATATAEDHSASESQQSTSEAANATGADGTDAKPRTRKRRPIMPATRTSSRQQKRRATQAAKAAAAAAKGDNDDGGDDTKDDDSDADDQDDAATEENDEDDADSDATPSKEKGTSASVPLTKSGRPRKKPGRKPKKHQDGK